MKKRVRVWLIVLACLFASLFLGRFAWLLLKPESVPNVFGGMGFQNDMVQNQSSESFSRKNYASSKITVAQPSMGPQVLDQKYERVANLSATSDSFDSDAGAVMKLAADAQAVVQSENSYGLPGGRMLSLSFGVTPERFEGLVEGFKKVAELESVTVVKTDKTAEYKELEAKRLSLEKTRDGLRALKVPGAALSDLVSLETKILEIEGQIQGMGVSLGDFAEGNSFCTVNFSLRERAASGAGSRVVGALFDALGWSLLTFLGIGVAALVALALAFLGSLVADKAIEYARVHGAAGKRE